MNRRLTIPDLGGARAAVLHRPHPTVDALFRQLTAIGLEVAAHWPELGPEAVAADYTFFDADMGHDGQFPWSAGLAPMPMIALIGSEAPGRIEWALSHGTDAQLLKPVGDGGVFGALLIARHAFEARRSSADEIAGLRRRLDERQTVVRAVMLLAAQGFGEDKAYADLRRRAMTAQETIEAAAHRVVAQFGEGDDDRRRAP
jgi:AmiR/NasT family two-component response regulator